MLRSLIQAAVLAVAVVGVSGCLGPGFGARQSFSETRRLEPDGRFTLKNVNGRVEVETWTKNEVRIEAEKSGSPGYVERTRVEVRGEGEHVDVETRSPRVWFFGGGEVDYRIMLPEDARVELRTVNGRISVRRTAGALRAEAVNGAIEVEDAVGSVQASSVNGVIRAEFRQAPSDGSTRLSTTNGLVTLVLPSDATGAFSASTVNGGIRTEFPLEVSGRIGPKRLDGRIGEGRARYDLRTVNGAVRILKRAGAG